MDKNVDDIFQAIKEQVNKINLQPWVTTLMFHGYHCLKHDPIPTSPSCYLPLDLFHYVGKESKGTIIRFDHTVYPVVPGGMPANVLTWDKLTTELKIMSHKKISLQCYCSVFISKIYS